MKLMELSRIPLKVSMCFIFGVPSWLYTILHSVLWRVLQNLKHVCYLYIGLVRALIKSCWVGSRRERSCDVTIMTIGIPVSLHILYGCSSWLNPIVSLGDRWGYVLSCRLTFCPLWLRIFLLLWWLLFSLFGLFCVVLGI